MAHSLADWLAAQGAWIAPSIQLKAGPSSSSSSSTFVEATSFIHAGTTRKSTLARIPLDLVLSHRSSALATALDGDDPLAAHAPALRLAVHAAHEIAQGSRSRWATYLALCPPREAVPIALLWEGDAQRWTRGTELAKECDRIGVNKAVLERFYDDVALPLLSSLPSTSSTSPASLSTFLHAYTLVSSRAFQVSSFHPLALVPLADAFNHSDPPHVHLASDAWVCPECGTLGACAHDDEGEGEPGPESAHEPPRTSAAPDEADTVDMVCERDVESGDEVFNTYGSALSNAHLVAAYGFLLEGNEHDVVSFERRGALETLVRLVEATGCRVWSLDELERELDELGAAWRTTSSGGPLLDADHPLIAPPSPLTSSSPSLDFFIDADARISPSLWLAVALVARHAASGTLPSASRRDDAPPAAKRARSTALRTEVEAARFLMWGEVDDPSLRLAIEFLAGERLLIDRVVSQWTFV
ncbi:hypothetical protein JCM8208_002872 [Rhodotorula glutinis]